MSEGHEHATQRKIREAVNPEREAHQHREHQGGESLAQAPALAAHAPGGQAAQLAVASLQRAVGNQAVQRMLAAQREDEGAESEMEEAQGSFVQREAEEEETQMSAVQREEEGAEAEAEEVQGAFVQREGDEEDLQMSAVQREDEASEAEAEEVQGAFVQREDAGPEDEAEDAAQGSFIQREEDEGGEAEAEEAQGSFVQREDEGAEAEAEEVQGAFVQRDEAEESESEDVQGAFVQREDEGDESEAEDVQGAFVQRKGAEAAAGAPPIGEQIAQKKGSGSPLEPVARTTLENALGQDLSDVRVHTDSAADALSKDLGAHAFTTGKDMFFQQGQYDPNSDGGMKLLAHEATHIGQQAAGPVAGTSNGQGVKVSDPSDTFERAASDNAERLAATGALTPAGGQGGEGAAAGAGASAQRELQHA